MKPGTRILNEAEKLFERTLNRHAIKFTRPEEDGTDQSNLDYHLTEFDLSVELKEYSTERLHRQLEASGKEKDGILVIIGTAGVKKFAAVLSDTRE